MFIEKKRRYAKLFFLVLAIFFMVYALFVSRSSPADKRWVFTVIEGLEQLSIDDAYRYFESRYVFQNKDLWSWAYLLPADALFKGGLHWLTNSNIFFMRLGHVLVNLVGVFALYRSCLLLNVRPALAFITCISLLLMPLFMVVSMSFYGESLLGSLLALAMYFHLSGHRRLKLVVASLMPLAQLQGLSLISGYFLDYLVKRSWGYFFLLALPGFIYFLYVMYVHGSVFEYLSFTQLHKLYPALPVPIQERGILGAFETFNIILILFSLTGVYFVWERIWSIYLGSLLWFFLVITIITHTNGYEPRYLFPCLPIMFLTLSVTLNKLWDQVNQFFSRGGGLIVFVLLLFFTIENLGQSDPIRQNFLAAKRWPVGEPHIGVPKFISIKSDSSKHGNDIARRVEAFLQNNENYKLVMINQHDIFYYLDKNNIPNDVKIAYTPFPPMLAYPAFGGRFHALSSQHPQAGFYQFDNVRVVGTEKALFIGDFSLLGLKADYQNPQYLVYELGYKFVNAPRIVHIIHRMETSKESQHYKGRNLCPELENVFCPDWRKGVYLKW